MDPAPSPPQPTRYHRDLQLLQNIIHTQQANISYATQAVQRANQQVNKMVEALVNIKSFSQHTITPLDTMRCRNKECKAMRERLETTMRSIIDLVNHSLQQN